MGIRSLPPTNRAGAQSGIGRAHVSGARSEAANADRDWYLEANHTAGRPKPIVIGTGRLVRPPGP
jgi:hypothetical protein